MQVKLLVIMGRSNRRVVEINLPTVIGRGREADLKVPHALVSRRHCELRSGRRPGHGPRSGFVERHDDGRPRIAERRCRPAGSLPSGRSSFASRIASPAIRIYPAIKYARPKDEVPQPRRPRRFSISMPWRRSKNWVRARRFFRRDRPPRQNHSRSRRPVAAPAEPPAGNDDDLPDFLAWAAEGDDEGGSSQAVEPEPAPPPPAAAAKAAALPAAKAVSDDEEEEPEPDPPPRRRRVPTKPQSAAARPPQGGAAAKKPAASPAPPRPTAKPRTEATPSDSWPEIGVPPKDDTVPLSDILPALAASGSGTRPPNRQLPRPRLSRSRHPKPQRSPR